MSTTPETRTWYEVERLGGYRIRPREVVRVTPKQVVYLEPHWQEGRKPTERRGARETQWDIWFETEAEAVEHVRAALTTLAENTRSAAVRAANNLAAFNATHPLESHTNTEKSE